VQLDQLLNHRFGRFTRFTPQLLSSFASALTFCFDRVSIVLVIEFAVFVFIIFAIVVKFKILEVELWDS
jgi:hypothetical protein